METVALTWTFRNFVTIALMGLLSYMAVTTAAKLWANRSTSTAQ
jgi:hypothetical protein